MQDKKIVYSVLDKGEILQDRLTEASVEYIVGNGTIEDDKLAVCDVLIPGMCHVREEVLKKAHYLRMIAKIGVGTEKIDIQACSARGIIVTNTPWPIISQWLNTFLP